MQGESENNVKPVQKSADERKLDMLYKLNQDLLAKSETLLKENDDLTKLLETFKENAEKQAKETENQQGPRKELTAPKSAQPTNARKIGNSTSIPVGNAVEVEKEMHRLQKEKQTLENLFVEINIDIHNKRKELEEMNKHMELARNTVKKIDLEIVAKTDFINFLETQYREEKQ